jgi:hypothetical protein
MLMMVAFCISTLEPEIATGRPDALLNAPLLMVLAPLTTFDVVFSVTAPFSRISLLTVSVRHATWPGAHPSPARIVEGQHRSADGRRWLKRWA